ncbi:MAG: N-acetyl-gamma-glutamyl-phosphate reductase, partial [Gammaproteobacteria bacterium]|nr:N-acetyl-gamma-glutamyl-phosphate reductase [Gammaproteobacteria bacterium]
RRCLRRSADVSILCLPDDAARDAVRLAGDDSRLIDASTAHRTDPEWVYGLPELSLAQAKAIAGARLVSNPGCYPQGFILAIRPLIEAGVLDPGTPLSVHALSGYSGGGRKMIEAYQGLDAQRREAWGARPYALELAHKHIPEMQRYAGTAKDPLFAPIVGNFYKGMVTQVPLFSDQVTAGTTPADIQQILAQTYAGARFVDVLPFPAKASLEGGFLSPTACNGTNRMEIAVFGNERRMLLSARYDNLGKGAAGAAVQNLNLMLGCDEAAGLE